jgi:hypothetical protein
MKYTNDEIVKAVTIIKEVCKEVEECGTCPYGDCMGECQILHNDVPLTWKVKETNEVWRAFD